MQKFLPSASYSCARGIQNTWEVSYLSQHIAKRSFLKYGGEDLAAKHILWEAWAHHTRRTGEACQVSWLQAMFGLTAEAKSGRDKAAAQLDSLPLPALGRQLKRRRKQPAEPTPDAAEPSFEAAAFGGSSAASAPAGSTQHVNPGGNSSASTARSNPTRARKRRAVPVPKTAAAKNKPQIRSKTADPTEAPASSNSSSSSSSSSSSESDS